MKLSIYLLVGICLSAFCFAQTPDPKTSPTKSIDLVRAFTDAFNAHDTAAMRALVSEDIEWLSVAGTAISIETRGADALVDAMKQYFGSMPSVRSVIEGTVESGSCVAVRERVFWKQGTSEQSQFALAVYQTQDGRIRSVWYFPAER